MKSKLKISAFLLVLQFLTHDLVSSIEVPVILWNIKGDSLHVKPISVFENDKKTFDDTLKDVLYKRSAKVLVFSLNELSMEDFHTNGKSGLQNSTLHSLENFLDHHPHMLLPSVKDPLNQVHNSHCGVEEIIVDQGIDKHVLQSVALALERSCVVILHVSESGIVTKRENADYEHIEKIFKPSFEDTSKDVVGVFSAARSSWESNLKEHHSFRNLLALEDDIDSNFVNVSGCIIMYAVNATISIGTEGNDTTQLIFPPTTEGSDCSNSTSILKLTFQAGGESIATAVLQLNFGIRGNSWITSSASLQLTGPKAPLGEIQLGSKYLGAPLQFSFSCGDFVMRSDNFTKDVSITFSGFQLQPYGVREVFDNSFDCVPFFTIPIWMGVFVALLFIIIMNMGVYALFSINTMDRFDDPKGKSISVPTAVD